ncbi:Tim10/DDP family zinc finger superfamily protein [Toxoplasma gondii TgCatPRC2]|uniref:Mitochondrial import inner membrane translocase subunit n=15 Tax=Toxoplasma gondii TaxID=5811 RepID=A0A125YM32_TOXGV|nr:Tim10/DDP family zinc finger superfamily protein [Toxoplasma gondii ME49]EPR59100.1 Tim10/DDP family zinc finger superfamily protein [Toxoplasma gondii GT1]ESS30455.1 Tim10/DDP family zinc finger superfamily protein [Toxoplasma gondii VEG]KAF4645269.1 Tim10/DDP family zinc finger superfamily protein [Toxoplasma gondii]KFG35376.1 Tim10/DDP family zinc finger superfamily protein [Toxoplasma gondii GAB2-2007-GAL-DOM2]KFG46663.1 Tim10/DDP family zinc finger superfamily protein [Toxoplasma gondi|eukprot:XP_008885084.1 Tim10/DDP family zinc finger superfamily protein [Hammondia hammondi]
MDSDIPADKMQEMETQLAMLLEGQRQTMKLLDRCFSRCIDVPGNSLTSGQQQCVSNCTKTYWQASMFCTERLRGLAEKELQAQGSASGFSR